MKEEISTSKAAILDACEYFYDMPFNVYVNLEHRRVISFQAVKTSTELWLRGVLNTKPSRKWSFYFTLSPMQSVQKQIISKFEQMRLDTIIKEKFSKRRK